MKYLALLLLFLFACAPEVQFSDKGVISEPVVISKDEVVSTVSEVQVAKEEEVSEIEVVSEAVFSEPDCEKLLSASDFASWCGKDAESIEVAYKFGTRNCFVNVKDIFDNRLTAGITLSVLDDAASEFDRRADVLKADVFKSVGERAYRMPAMNREEIFFLRGNYLVQVGSDINLCSKDGLLSVAQSVDKNLK